jgi:pimeloyl-ACP methyl ester carboxylesterase
MILNTIRQGEGPPVVLLHGLFGAAKNLGVVARGLAGQGEVISMDLRNHGDSPRGAAMDFLTMAADVAETMAALEVPAARVVGHSLGGKTAMALALTRPAMVERLVVMDIAPVTYGHDYDDYVQAMLGLELTPSLTRQEADAALAPVVAAAPMRAFLLNNLILGEAAMGQMIAWEDPPGMQPYEGPALFLRGGLSDYVRPSADEPIARLFPDARRATIEGASHWLHAEQPERVISALKEFLFP